MFEELRALRDTLLSYTKPRPAKIGSLPGEVDLKVNSFPGPHIEHIIYDQNSASCEVISEVPSQEVLNSSDKVNWICINGFGDNNFVESLKNRVDLHKLVLEDIVNVNHPPKLESLEESTYILLRTVPSSSSKVDTTVSIFVKNNFLLLFNPTGDFPYAEKIVKRIQADRGVIRNRKVDYLLFVLMDVIVDSYFPRIDALSNSVKEIDRDIFTNRNFDVLPDIKTIRQVLNIYSDNLHPLKDILTRLQDVDIDFVDNSSIKYFKDCYDHVSHLCERINRLKESTSDIMSLSISINGQRMNEIMKMLTMMSSIFIPLSFICGLYGMNFDTNKSPLNMPELGWYYGYPFVIGVMLSVVCGMLIYFNRRKWF